MGALWDTFGYRGTFRGQRGYYPCKDMVPLFQGSTPIEPHFLGHNVAPYAEPINGSMVHPHERYHESTGMARYQNVDGHLSADVRLFNLFTPSTMHRRNEYIDPTYNARMQSVGDYAASVVASGIGKMHGGGVG